MGWGGAVKGASAAQADLPEFPAGNPGYAGKWPVTDRRIERENRADYLIDHIGMIAETAEREETQLAASLAYIERVRGKVPQTNLNIPGDLTDLTPDAMRAELERIGRKEAISEAGTVAPSVPD